MQITAKLIQLLPLQSGTGKNGQWKKQDVIVELDDKFPKKVCISFWGDKIDEKVLVVGNSLDIFFDIESREFNGKWYTDIKAWKAEVDGNSPISNTGQLKNALPKPDFSSIEEKFEPPEVTF